MSRRRSLGSVSVEADVDVADILAEMSEDDLREEIEARGAGRAAAAAARVGPSTSHRGGRAGMSGMIEVNGPWPTHAQAARIAAARQDRRTCLMAARACLREGRPPAWAARHVERARHCHRALLALLRGAAA